jgi:hypothetical protein
MTALAGSDFQASYTTPWLGLQTLQTCHPDPAFEASTALERRSGDTQRGNPAGARTSALRSIGLISRR